MKNEIIEADIYEIGNINKAKLYWKDYQMIMSANFYKDEEHKKETQMTNIRIEKMDIILDLTKT